MADYEKAHGDAVGDTNDVHDLIDPLDMPPGHPGRPAAERKLAEAQKREGAPAGEASRIEE